MDKKCKWADLDSILNRISVLQWVDHHQEAWCSNQAHPKTITNPYNKCNNKLLTIAILNILPIILPSLVTILNQIVVKVNKCIPAQAQHITSRFHLSHLCLANKQITLKWIILMVKGCRITIRIHFLIRCHTWHKCSIMKALECLVNSLLAYPPMMLLWRLPSRRNLEDRVLGSSSHNRIQCIRIEDLRCHQVVQFHNTISMEHQIRCSLQLCSNIISSMGHQINSSNHSCDKNHNLNQWDLQLLLLVTKHKRQQMPRTYHNRKRHRATVISLNTI